MTRHSPRNLALILAVALFLLLRPDAGRLTAFGAQGHHVVARIAWALMTPAARDAATALLGEGERLFVATSVWADDVRSTRTETANWHFVNIPADQATYNAARDCPSTERGDCVIAAIARARAELADRARPAELRAESLKFLVHFVGDLHQPLHAIGNHDRGGNDVRVTSLREGPDGRATNLHAVWDSGVINLSSQTEAARATALLADLKAHPVDAHTDVVKWAEESHDIALRVTYRYPGFSLAGPGTEPVTLGEAYLAQAAVTIDQRIKAGGARLAAVLNGVFAR